MAAGSRPKARLAYQSVPKNVQFAMALAVVGGLLFVRPFLGTILFAALIAFIFNPVYQSILKRTNRYGLSLTATMLIAILSLLLPLVIVTAITVNQANAIISKFQKDNVSIGTAQIEEVVERGTDRVNQIVRAFPGGENFELDKDKVQEQLKEVSADLLQGLVNFIKQAGGAFFGLISTLILAFFLIVAMLRYQTELLEFLRKLSPFHNSVTSTYLERVGAMTKAMVKGQFVIALAQGFASALSLWLVGVDYFLFFFVLLTFLSFIPLGGGILTIPIGLVIMLTGNIAQGLFVILFHILGVSNIDNILRPKLVPKTARLNSALTLLAVFSGLAVFGAPGVIYGPVLMIIIVTTFQMYADYNSRIKRPLPPSTI